MTESETAGAAVAQPEKVTVRDTLDPTAVVVAPPVESEPAALVPEGAQSQPGTPETEADPAKPDPLNAAIAATTGEPEVRGMPEPGDLPSPERLAAVEAHIKAGVEKAMAGTGGSEIVTVGHLRAAIEALLRHLHFDHPENYLPK